jgi:hypothetical protein
MPQESTAFPTTICTTITNNQQRHVQISYSNFTDIRQHNGKMRLEIYHRPKKVAIAQ